MFSYHNHSNLGDGFASPEEQLVSAYNHGISEFGLSDHYCIWFDGSTPGFSIKDIDNYFNVLLKLREVFAHKVKVKFGVELENLPATLEEESEVLKKYPLDYIIGGTHFVDDWPIDSYKEWWTVLGPEEIDRRIKKYWDAHYKMCKDGDIDIVAHFDTYEKWGPLVDNDYTEYFVECLKVCKERGLATEINTAKKTSQVNAFYPHNEFIELIAEYDIPVIISTDAHYPTHVTRYMSEAKELFGKYNIKRIARFENRKMLIEYVKF